MKRFFSLLISAAILLSLSACGQGEKGDASPSPPSESGSQTEEPGTERTPFTLAIYLEQSLHPALSSNRANLALAPLLYESLFVIDETFQAVPVLCRSYDVSPDGLTWTFTLREEARFSDGTPLTGKAVAAALELAGQEGSRYENRLAHVTGVTAGENSVTLVLDRPNGALPLLLDIPIALGEGERPLGTGPYALSEEGQALVARDGWWQEKTLPTDRIALRPMTKSDDRIFAFDSGDISLVEVDLMGTNALGYSGSYAVWDYPTADLIYLGFQTQSGPCQSAEVRRALARGINRESITRVAYAAHAVPANLPAHPNSPLYDRQLAGRLEYAPEVMVTELERLGVAGRELVLLVNTENMARASVAQWIAEQLEAAGVKVRVDKLPFEDYVAALEAGRFDLYLGEVVLTADFDLSALLSSGGSLNYGGWQDPRTDLLLTELEAAKLDERPAAAGALYGHLGLQVPLVPVCFKNNSVLTKWGQLTGLSPVRGNLFYGLEHWTIS